MEGMEPGLWELLGVSGIQYETIDGVIEESEMLEMLLGSGIVLVGDDMEELRELRLDSIAAGGEETKMGGNAKLVVWHMEELAMSGLTTMVFVEAVWDFLILTNFWFPNLLFSFFRVPISVFSFLTMSLRFSHFWSSLKLSFSFTFNVLFIEFISFLAFSTSV